VKQLLLQGFSPFPPAPIDAPDELVTGCKSEAMAVRWCLDFAREEFGITQRKVAERCGWKNGEGFLSEIADENNPKRLPPKRLHRFALATGCRLVEQWQKRQEVLRELTGKQTAHDKARGAVALMRAQYVAAEEARAAA
jgi:hypothetical protein